MTTLASPLRPAPVRPWHGAGSFAPALPGLLLLAVLVGINPVVWQGGRVDDWFYLEAARCMAEHGLCLPGEHWARRIAIVWPTAASIAIFGESAAALAIAPLAYAVAAVLLLARLVERAWGRTEAVIAAAALAATPVFFERALWLNIDTPELVFMLSGLLCLQGAREKPRLWLIGGLFLGLAVLARPTQFATVGLVVLALAAVPELRRRILPVLAGFAVPLLLEAAAWAIATGNPLGGWQLSLAHTRIPSTELAASVDTSRSPLFNPAYIAGWKRDVGIELHWTVDGLLNLLTHPSAGLTLMLAAALLLTGASRLQDDPERRRQVLLLLGAAGAFFAALTYGFAIDPKPRMFLPVIVIASALVGLGGAAALRNGRPIILFVGGALLLCKAVLIGFDRYDVRSAYPTVRMWLEADRQATLEPNTGRIMTLLPEARARAGRASQDRVLLMSADGDCTSATAAGDYAGWRIARQQPLRPGGGRTLDLVRSSGIVLRKAGPASLCLVTRPGS